MKRVDIHSVKVLFNDRFRIVEAVLNYERPNAEMSGPARRLSFEREDSAAAVVFNPKLQTILMTRQFRYPTLQKGPGWPVELVAGSIEEGESPEDCIRREIREELGYDALTLTRISTFYASPGGSSERIHLFQAQVSTESKVATGGGNRSEQEDIEVIDVPFLEVPALLTNGNVVDAKTIIGLYWLIQTGLTKMATRPEG